MEQLNYNTHITELKTIVNIPSLQRITRSHVVGS